MWVLVRASVKWRRGSGWMVVVGGEMLNMPLPPPSLPLGGMPWGAADSNILVVWYCQGSFEMQQDQEVLGDDGWLCSGIFNWCEVYLPRFRHLYHMPFFRKKSLFARKTAKILTLSCTKSYFKKVKSPKIWHYILSSRCSMPIVQFCKIENQSLKS